MGKVKELLLEHDFTVGKKVIPYTYKRCGVCSSWFGFRYDEAEKQCLGEQYFKYVCPECECEYVCVRAEHLPKEYMKFVEVE